MFLTQLQLLEITIGLLSIAGLVVLASWFQCTRHPRSVLPIAVSRLHATDVWCIVILILLKYALKPLGLIARLPRPAPGESESVDVTEAKDKKGDGSRLEVALPPLHIQGALTLSSADEKRYDVATASLLEERVLFLPALTTPAMLVLLANRNCPVLPFGSVNVRSRFEFLHPAACRYPGRWLDFSEGSDGVVVEASMGGPRRPGRRVKRGVEVDVEVVVSGILKGEEKGQRVLVFKQIVTILQFAKNSGEQGSNDKKQTAGDETAWIWNDGTTSSLVLDKGAPERWAALCCDYNPIHMLNPLARAFGFPSKIAHGSHAVASIIQQWEQDETNGISDEGVQDVLLGDKPCYLDVQFKRPMPLPAELKVRYGRAPDRYKVFGFKAELGQGKEAFVAEVGELKARTE
ncbi:hypothetical protein K431DRAFT_343889 [Polychaeton citri CBS 116435]|uniref:MaoC-like domain-containing protein n=1 Tax=Polychaeton citri CBS 116435 TaxID=1314669 RepID=A0A9P4US20_9PEZI|nr:hypothetical protein K431DRAFT_343889 [Polychaeton citri CBS 116435]